MTASVWLGVRSVAGYLFRSAPVQLFKATASGNHPGARINAESAEDFDDDLFILGCDLGSDVNLRRKRIGLIHRRSACRSAPAVNSPSPISWQGKDDAERVVDCS